MHYAWEALAAGVYRCRLPFLDVSVGLVTGPSAVVLIDCGSTLAEAEGIAEDVLDICGRPVTDVVLTHHHFDHILGSAGFPNARLHGSGPVATALSSRIGVMREDALRYGAPAEEINRTVDRIRSLDHVVSSARIDMGDRNVRVEHPGRGHTDHDLVVLAWPGNPGDRPVVFCGDLVEESAAPAVDEGSDLASWPVTLDQVVRMGGPDAVYVPGHGTVVSAGFLAEQRDWLRRAAGNVTGDPDRAAREG